MGHQGPPGNEETVIWVGINQRQDVGQQIPWFL